MDIAFEPYKVYVRVNESNHIIEVNSSDFLQDTTGWVQIDEGYGDKYHHAQGNYFPNPIMTDGGAYRYRLADGVVKELTAEEIEEAEADVEVNNQQTQEERIAELEEALEMLLSGVTE